MNRYDHRSIEKKWQKRWEESGAFVVPNEQSPDVSVGVPTRASGKKKYLLIEFPYPSGDGLHVGHVRSWAALDIVARKHRAMGEQVLYPIGWDAFGLPTENFAIKTGKNPRDVTKANTDNFRRQIKSIGLSFDWSREINTTDPAYYKWTQWIFLKLYEKGLAYKAKTFINWCPKDKIGLANEEVVDGACERCGTAVEKREKEQWMLAITKYAQRLYDDLESVDYIERAKVQQKNWIGPSEGAEIEFPVAGSTQKIKVFTTRPDTLFGATCMVLAPEHALVKEFLEKVSNKDEVSAYIAQTKQKSDIERTTTDKEKTGVELKGIKAVNPATKEEIPVFIADYVLATYGTGALMAVPAHDERDFAFAKKFGVALREVVVPRILFKKNPPVEGKKNVERKNVHAIVRDPSTGKYLALTWKKYDWLTFPMGGIEEGESLEEAARREVKEETGFTDLTLTRILPGTVRAEYFAAHKDQNRISYTNAVLFDLTSHEQVPVAAEESDEHDVTWIEDSVFDDDHMTHAEIGEWKEQIKGQQTYTGSGVLINSGEFSGLTSEEAKKKITEAVGGKLVTTFKLRDWVFSRQRYWGEPIPMIKCPACKEKTGNAWVPVPESQLPVTLPEVEKYVPTDNGESPLASMHEWVNTTCPTCGGPAERETDVMPNWAGSSWYWLRYCDPTNREAFADKSLLEYWTPVDWYNGGMEHTVLHLLYSRFWHKFLYDLGLVPTTEPYMKRTSHGLILAEDGSKMSKSKGNTVSPDEIVEKFGADALRLYEMFLGPFDQPVAWSTSSMSGVYRFLERVWDSQEKIADMPVDEKTNQLLHQTIKKVGEDIEHLKMNTAVSALMILSNHLGGMEKIPRTAYISFLQMLAPFAPHVSHELAEALAVTPSQLETWPIYDESKLVASTANVAVQVNGKVRGTIELALDTTEADALAAARREPNVAKWLAGKKEVRALYIKGRVVTFVVE